MKRYVLVALAALIAPPGASARTIARLEKPPVQKITAVGFELPRRTSVEIEAVGRDPRYGDDVAVFFWIIDADSREPVWEMDFDEAGRIFGDRTLRKVKDKKKLGRGRYEMYVAAGRFKPPSLPFDGLGVVGRAVTDIVNPRRLDPADVEKSVRRCSLRVSAPSRASRGAQSFRVDAVPGSLVAFNRLGDDEHVRARFRLSRPMGIRVYSLIEYPRGYRRPVDGGWIVDAATRQRVWQMDRDNTNWAGGGSKNRKYDEDLWLEAGEYELVYGTDDSHSYPKFNVSPPWDPFSWGVTLLPGRSFDRSAFELLEPAAEATLIVEEPLPLVDLRRAGNHAALRQAFRLSEAETLHVRALGEAGRDCCVDRGWIVEAGSRRTVWEMDKQNTSHAGGADKNRLFDGLIRLGPGDYIAYYSTDDSHAFGSWNRAPPYQPEEWGLVIMPGPGSETSTLQLIGESQLDTGAVLARILRVGNDAEREQRFTLDRASRVMVHAVGEGTGGRMYDYGSIVDAESGRSVWVMSYRRTSHAGGASKNREFEGLVTLEPGTYYARYVTDDSHAFGSWNAQRPHDPESWGLTVSLLGAD